MILVKKILLFISTAIPALFLFDLIAKLVIVLGVFYENFSDSKIDGLLASADMIALPIMLLIWYLVYKLIDKKFISYSRDNSTATS